MTRTAFERLAVSPEVENQYLDRELAEIRAQLEAQKSRGARLTVKKLEKMVARAEAALQKRLDHPVDVGLTFESTGIDYLFIDEAHGYKNLATVSNIQGAAIPGSKRASDLHMKLEYLRVAHGERVATFATATPIANSITEAHVMCRYLRPDLLAHAGIKHFDAWAATFGETVTQMEMAVTGGGNYRLNTRFARFQNVPEMLRIWHVFADVKTAEDLDLPVPPLKPRPDGQRLPEPVVIPTPPEVADYLHTLAARAERVKNRQVEPEEDNMLKISTDGRKAALDMRLVADGRPIAGICKLEMVADNIARIHAITRNVAYRIPGSDQRHPALGSFQIVFCDLSTPNPQRWNAYRELRRLLAERGVPAEQVRFAHEARNDAEKARLFEACRSGQVAVLVGSTEKMGVGTNIQARAIALHHIDCPWRPADIEQRDGRILRQGNQNSGVRIYRYVVEGSFDAYSWQTVERKARFIGQVMQGRLDVRCIDDIADSTLSFAEVKALAAGDTLILEQANLSAEVTRLQRLARAHRNNQAALHMTVQSLAARLIKLDEQVAAIDEAITRHVDTRGDAFAITLGDTAYDNRAQAGIELVHLLEQAPTARQRPLGIIGGLALSALVRYDLSSGDREALISFDGLPFTEAHATLVDARTDPLTLIRQIESRANGLDALRAKTMATRADAHAEAERAQQMIGAPFKHADTLADASHRLAAVDAELAAKARAQEQQAAAAAAAPEQDPSDPAEHVVAAASAASSDDIDF